MKTLDQAREWISTLVGHVQSVGNARQRFQAELFELRLDAWTDPGANLTSKLQVLRECGDDLEGELANVVATLSDIATATRNIDIVLATAKAIIPPQPRPDHEYSWYRAEIGLARLMADGGDREGAMAVATRIQHLLESHAEAPWLKEAVEGTSHLAQELRAGGARGFRAR